MYEVGDLVRLNNDILLQHGYTCDPQTVFRILKISGNYPYTVGYYIDATIDDRHIIKCNASEADCVVGYGLLIPAEPYEDQMVSRETIECML